jgi:hypothetical protein
MNTEYLLQMCHEMRYAPFRLTATVCCMVFIAVTVRSLLPEANHASDSCNVRIKCYGRVENLRSPVVVPESPGLEMTRSFLIPLAMGILGFVLGNLVLDYIREKRRMWRDGKSKTPVVIFPSAHVK